MQKIFILTLVVIITVSQGFAEETFSYDLDKFHVCTVSNKRTEGLDKLEISCKKLQINLEIIGLDQPYFKNGTKLVRMEEYLRTLQDDDIVMFVDAFDVIIIGDKEAILTKFFSMNVPFLCM